MTLSKQLNKFNANVELKAVATKVRKMKINRILKELTK